MNHTLSEYSLSFAIYFSIQIKSGKMMSILLYVSLRKTVVTVGHRRLRGLRRQFKTSGFFCRIKFINHPSVKYIQDVRRIRPFSFYLNGVNRFELTGILYEFVRNIFKAFMTFLKLKCL